MKKSSKFDKWIDRSITRLMELTKKNDLRNTGESPPGVNEEPTVLTIPSYAEESDFLSINEWMKP